MIQMNSLKVNSFLVLTAVAFILSACAPKDEKLIRPDSSAQFKTESITSDVSVKLAFAAFDKTLEAVTYLKVLLNPSFAQQKGLSVETLSTTANQSVVKIVSSGVQNETATLIQISEINLLATITKNEAQEIVTVLIQDNSGGQAKTELYSKSNGQKPAQPSVISLSKSKRILILKSQDAGVYNIETDAVDSIKSFNRKNLNEVYSDSLSQIQAKSRIQWNGKAESLDLSIKIISLAPEYQPQLSKVRTQLVSDGPVELSVNANECSYFEGKIALTSVKTKADTVVEKQVLNFSSAGITVSDKPYTYKWADCKTRPLIDLTQSL